MKTVHVVFAALAVFLIIAVHSSEAIHCYVCNTREGLGGEECWEPAESDTDFLKDCEAEGIAKGANYTLCRKIRQDVEGELRVQRSCGTSGNSDAPGPEGRCVERTGTTKIYMTYCECEGDKCNSAISVSFSTLALFISALVGIKLSL